MLQIRSKNGEVYVFADYKSFQETVRDLCKKGAKKRSRYETRKLRAIRDFMEIPEGMSGRELYNAIINGGRDYYLVVASSEYRWEALMRSYKADAKKLIDDILDLTERYEDSELEKSARNLIKEIDGATSLEVLEDIIEGLRSLSRRYKDVL